MSDGSQSADRAPNFATDFAAYLAGDFLALEPERARPALARACHRVYTEATAALRERSDEVEFGEACAAARGLQTAAAEVALAGRAEFMSIDSLKLIVHEPWDEVMLASFLCWCALVSLAARSWAPGVAGDDAFERALCDELAALAARPLSALLAAVLDAAGRRHPGCLVEVAYRVCFEAARPELFDVPALVAPAGDRLGRRGVRLFERAFVLEACRGVLEEDLDRFAAVAPPEAAGGADEALVREWFGRCVRDANNALLLRLDEWAALNGLAPLRSFEAAGERGGCPEEHRGAPAFWVASCYMGAEEFASFSRECKRNEAHAQNVFVCFSHALAQNFSFDWGEKCFASSANPVAAARKMRAFLSEGARRKPPLVVQRAGGADVCYETPAGRFRVRCSGAAETVAAWLAVVRHACPRGEYGRRRSVDAVVHLMREQVHVAEAAEAEAELGGAAHEVTLR